jgi:predicted RNase H-like HicB family nuclease/post-segregation antitoxin (ccd killing protein)
MSKPNYRATVTFDPERKLFVARAPELEHCSAEGATRAEALTKLEEEIDAQLANMLSHGSTPPRAVDEETFSGEISAKISKLLHRELAYQARSEGIDVDHLVGELLAAAMESRKQTRGVRSGNARPREDQQPHDNVGNRFEGGRGRGFGGRGNSAHLLDDRANFIEYVRGLEQQGAQRHGGHGGPGGGGGGRGRRGRGGGRGGNPNHGGGQRMHGGGGNYGGGRPQHGGNGNFGGGNGGANHGNGAPQHGGGQHGGGEGGFESQGAPSPSTPHDPDSSGNV